jgi:hypothetical protein
LQGFLFTPPPQWPMSYLTRDPSVLAWRSIFWGHFLGHFLGSLCATVFVVVFLTTKGLLLTFLTNFREPTTKNDKYKILEMFIRRIYCFSNKITVAGFRSHVYRWKATIENPTLCV